MKSRSLRILKKLLLGVLYTLLGTFLGVVGLYVFILNQGPSLQVWHQVHLEEEFTADKSDEVKTLADYLALEDRVFKEMEDKVYAKTTAGEQFALDRYQHGSLADPTGFRIDYNRSFEWKAPDPKGGVLLLHGLSDSPYSMVGIGQILHAKGLHVLALRMPGHGTVPSGLVHARWQDLAAATKIGMRHLQKTLVAGQPIFVVGYSTGAALAVDYSLEALTDKSLPRARSLVLLSPAIGVSAAASFAKWQSKLSWILGMAKVNWTGILPEYDPYKYGSFAVNAGDLIYQLTVAIGAKLDALEAGEGTAEFPPTLAFSSAVDATVLVTAVVDQFLQKVGNKGNEFVLFDINRLSEMKPLVANDPAAALEALRKDRGRPFAFRLVTNRDDRSKELVSLYYTNGSDSPAQSDLGLSWPRGTHSLAHVSIPFSMQDPLYGDRSSETHGLNLGYIEARGENGVLNIPANGILRLRHNPLFPFVEKQVVDFLGL
jgi:alpha-beta hydrolase superfamily lysophospholipase